MSGRRLGFVLVATLTCKVFASGPADRVPTDPRSLVSPQRAGGSPLPVDAILQTTRIAGVGLSADGKQIVYTSNASGRLNLWTMRSDGTGAKQLTHSDDSQFGAVFSPDASQIVYAQDKGGDECFDLYVLPAGGGTPRDLTSTDAISETGPVFARGGKLLALQVKPKSSPITNLALMTWPAGNIRQLTHEADPKAGWSPLFWSHDDRFLYAQRNVGLDDSDIFRIDIQSGQAINLTTHAGHELISASDLSRDDRVLLISSNRKGGFQNVALFDPEAKQTRWVTDTQWQAEPGSFSPDGKTFTYLINADGRIATYFADIHTLKGSTRGVPDGLNFPSGDPSPFFPDGSCLMSHEDSVHPANLYVLRPSGALEQITHNESPELAAAVLPSSQLVVYKSFDGRLISAFVWVPLNLQRDGTAAAVVMPHGGPTGQTVDNFNARAALLASRGFVVIAPNVRGSTGYGMEFQQANIKDLGGADLKDEIAGVEFLKASGFIDPKRVGIWGGSYGGFMTLMAIGKTPTVWAAAVDEFGILDWYTMLQHEDPRLQEYEKQLLGDPVKDRAVYEASSPLRYIRSAQAPLLVLQGERDIRVPREEAEQVVTILKGQGRTVEAVYYPEEGHGFAKREHQRDELSRSLEWLSKYLQAPSSPAAVAGR